MKKLTRRNFLKSLGIAGPSIFIFGKVTPLFAGPLEHAKNQHFWKNGKFIQTAVDVSAYEKNLIRAHVDGSWHTYQLRSASRGFIEWNVSKRIEFLEAIKIGQMPGWGGPHSGAVATYGLKRLDSEFSLNNAIKGIGLAPKDDLLDSAIKRLKDTYEASMSEKMEVLKSLYENPEQIDWRKQTSLELYSEPDFETHTFLNCMKNPLATIVFLDIPSYELRTIVRIISNDDPQALPSEKKLFEYVNLAHSYMHGKFERLFPLLLFYIIEEFDNTPGSKLGIRSVPSRE